MNDDLETLQRETFDYFVHEANPANGLIRDKTEANWPASIAATGLALGSYAVGVKRGFMSRKAAVERTVATLRFSWNSPHGPEPDTTGHRGFYYHFLDMQTAGVLGAATCRPSTALCCWREYWRLPLSSTGIQRPKQKSAPWRMRFTVGPTGAGR